MNYYIKEFYGDFHHAGSKAKNDIVRIFEEYNLTALPVSSEIKLYDSRWRMVLGTLIHQFEIADKWKNAVSCLKSGDTVVIQYPPKNKPVTWGKILKSLKKHNVRVIVLIHDFETLRNVSGKAGRLVYQSMEKSILRYADKIIFHNDKMIQRISELGYDIGDKAVSLELFDYLIPGNIISNGESDALSRNTAVIAGNLSYDKANYIYQIPQGLNVNLYGGNYKENDQPNLHYFGSFPPDELPLKLRGGYGLVWDGNSAETCSGSCGEYLRINNPHKTSLYLACGMPVIVWKCSAVADFVDEHKVGISVDSLTGLESRLSKVTEEEYRSMKANAVELSAKIRSGFFTKSALDKALNQ